jgi:hypothetical protein
LEKRTRRALATVAIGAHGELLTLSFPSLTRFAETHGYQLEVCTRSLDVTKPPAWTKLLFIIDLMNRYEEIFWIDSDAIFLETSKDIYDEVDPNSELSWVYHEYENQRHPNTGVMYIRVNDNTKKLFQTANLQHDLETHPWWDQAALMRVMGIQTSDIKISEGITTEKLKIKEQELSLSWNSIRQNSSSSPIIRHFAGEPFWIRKFLMAEYANPEAGSSRVLQDMVMEFLVLQNHQASIVLSGIAPKDDPPKIYFFVDQFKKLSQSIRNAVRPK